MHKHKDTQKHGQVIVLSVVLSEYRLMVIHTIYVQVLLKKGPGLQQLRSVFCTLMCSKHMSSLKRTICHLEWTDNSQLLQTSYFTLSIIAPLARV